MPELEKPRAHQHPSVMKELPMPDEPEKLESERAQTAPSLPGHNGGASQTRPAPALSGYPSTLTTSQPRREPSPTAQPEIHSELSSEPHVLAINQFCLYYGKHKALHDISMPIAAQKVTALVGPSGCGKSTLLRSINRLNDLIEHVRTEGQILFRDENVYGSATDVIGLRKRLGMVFQKSNPFPMSIFENVVYARRIAGERSRARLHEVCERSLRGAALWDEVKDRLHSSALGLSGGQQQRLCIARAIAADEPMPRYDLKVRP